MNQYRERIQDLLADYAWHLDNDKLEQWTELFTEDARYEILPRDNVDRGFSLALMACRNQAMLRDRVLALRVANEYNVHYDRHVIGIPKFLSVKESEVSFEANYVVIQTDQHGNSKVFSSGVYKDRVVLENGQLRIKDKKVVIDTFCVPTLIATPL